MVSEIRFLDKTGDNWVNVQLERSGLKGLPYGIKVDWEGIKANREYFTVLEGLYKGERGSTKSKGPNTSWFTPNIKHQNAAFVRFNRKQQALWIGKSGPYNAFTGAFTHPTDGKIYTQVPLGTYPICIPDYPHSATRAAYSQWGIFHKSWFLIDNCPGNYERDSRYLHTGEISEGCVTARAFVFNPNDAPQPSFTDLPNWSKLAPGGLGMPYPASPAPLISWDTIYDSLILCRAGDKHVGSLTVE